MEFKFGEFFLNNLEAAGAIGGYVSISIIGFAIFSYIAKKKFNKPTSKFGPRWFHPIVGSLFGSIPGCGATIVASSLYKNGKISFGGLFATFISTLGEGSFVLLGASDEAKVEANLEAYLIITVFGFITGIVFGYLVDFASFRHDFTHEQRELIVEQSSTKDQYYFIEKFIDELGFYLIMTISIFLAPSSLMALWGGEIEYISDIIYFIYVSLSIICIIYYLYKLFYKQLNISCDDSIKSTTYHAVKDVAMVVTFVFLGLFIANYIIDELVGEDKFKSWMNSSTYVVVLISALIGLMPGCGGMIVVAVTYMSIPDFPIAALIAAAIATSGDGIFPLLAENKKDGLIITGLGLIVAIFVGYLSLFLGFN